MNITFTEDQVIDQKQLAQQLFPVISSLTKVKEFGSTEEILGDSLCVLAAALMAAQKLSAKELDKDFFSVAFPLWGAPAINPVTNEPYASGWLPVKDNSITHPAILFYLKQYGLNGDVLGLIGENKITLGEIFNLLKNRNSEVVLASVRGGVLSKESGHIVIVYPIGNDQVQVINPMAYPDGGHLKIYPLAEFESYLTGKYIIISNDNNWTEFADKNLQTVLSMHGRSFPQ